MLNYKSYVITRVTHRESTHSFVIHFRLVTHLELSNQKKKENFFIYTINIKKKNWEELCFYYLVFLKFLFMPSIRNLLNSVALICILLMS